MDKQDENSLTMGLLSSERSKSQLAGSVVEEKEEEVTLTQDGQFVEQTWLLLADNN